MMDDPRRSEILVRKLIEAVSRREAFAAASRFSFRARFDDQGGRRFPDRTPGTHTKFGSMR